MSGGPPAASRGRARPTLTVTVEGASTTVEIRPRAAAARTAIVVLTAAWVALAVAWVAAAAASRAPLVFSAAVLPFLAIGTVVTSRMLAAFPAATRVIVDPVRGMAVLPRGLLAGRPMAASLDSIGECRTVTAPGSGGLLAPVLAVEAGLRSLRLGAGLGQSDLRALADALRAALERARAASLTAGSGPVDSDRPGGVPEEKKERR